MSNQAAKDESASCYLCGKYIKKSEVIPDETYPVCDECEAKLEFELL
ncbi:hypothetical protein [Lactococcus lactis]|nr:hypothetical protein [Lactococcus lactis]KST98516.1 hypothetical protein KF196_1484 [Lactococcus lactis subsp. lactis]